MSWPVTEGKLERMFLNYNEQFRAAVFLMQDVLMYSKYFTAFCIQEVIWWE